MQRNSFFALSLMTMTLLHTQTHTQDTNTTPSPEISANEHYILHRIRHQIFTNDFRKCAIRPNQFFTLKYPYRSRNHYDPNLLDQAILDEGTKNGIYNFKDTQSTKNPTHRLNDIQRKSIHDVQHRLVQRLIEVHKIPIASFTINGQPEAISNVDKILENNYRLSIVRNGAIFPGNQIPKNPIIVCPAVIKENRTVYGNLKYEPRYHQPGHTISIISYIRLLDKSDVTEDTDNNKFFTKNILDQPDGIDYSKQMTSCYALHMSACTKCRPMFDPQKAGWLVCSTSIELDTALNAVQRGLDLDALLKK